MIQEVQDRLIKNPKVWLITGVAGFIGSNLLENLLKLNQKIIGLDNLSTGHKNNLLNVKSEVSENEWKNFVYINGDIRRLEDCKRAMIWDNDNTISNVDYVLHQAALGSVPRSIADPLTSNEVNIGGFLNILVASREAKVKSFTYAASSSTYGDHPDLPKVEDKIGNPLSPYAVTKLANEIYAKVFFQSYEFNSIGLRYFNVFGKRQDPKGAYAAVIPKWVNAILNNEEVFINGDGETSRDFSYIENIVQANILAATASGNALNNIYNIAYGEKTSLNDLYKNIVNNLASLEDIKDPVLTYRSFRSGDVKHSQADITKARNLLGYKPAYNITKGMKEYLEWYTKNN
tara:strand:- start:13093 stop:14130 length:1038 start_codon:yes stop_codon:yes gene_type:complete